MKPRFVIPAVVLAFLSGSGAVYAQTANDDSATLANVCAAIEQSAGYTCTARTTTTTTSTTLPPTTTSVASTTTTVPPTTTLPAQTVGQRFGGVSEPLARTSVARSELDREALELKNLGMSWHRFDYTWYTSEPSHGTFTWSTVDQPVLADRAQGIQSLPILYMTPAWARGSCGDDKCVPTTLTWYGDWVGQACAHLAPLGVTTVELWNEQNLAGFFHPLFSNADRDKYVTMAKDATTKCKTAAPGMKVLAGGISTADTVFQAGNGAPATGNGAFNTMDYYGRQGLYQVVDGQAWHPYLDDYTPGVDADSTGSWPRQAPKAIARALAIMDLYAPGRGLQLWNTESADPRITSPQGPNAEQEQANKAQAVWDGFLPGGFEQTSCADRCGPFFWFTLRDWDTASETRARTFGLMSPTWSTTAHLAYAATKTALARTT